MLAEMPNFRDLGGVACGPGRQIRTGRVFRSPAPTRLSPEGVRAIEALDPAAIIDLRGPEEAAGAPHSALPDRRVALPIIPSAGARMREAIAGGRMTPEVAHEMMVETYRGFVEEHTQVFGAFLGEVLRAGDRPVVFHCTAGKDRTGFAAALLLSALGADDAAVERDYLRTAELWSPPPELASAVPEAAQGAMFGVHRDYLASAFTALEAAHGDARRFAVAALGAEDFDTLSASLVVPASA